MYISKHYDYEVFILTAGGIYTIIFWIGQVLIGLLLPLYLLLNKNSNNESNFMISSLLVVFGSFAAIYVIIISGQAFPLNIFNDYMIVESSFYDNVIHDYTPSLYEIGLGIGGVALSLIIILIAIRNLDFLPSVIQIRKPLVDEKSD